MQMQSLEISILNPFLLNPDNSFNQRSLRLCCTRPPPDLYQE
jgi:hypothetical protein